MTYSLLKVILRSAQICVMKILYMFTKCFLSIDKVSHRQEMRKQVFQLFFFFFKANVVLNIINGLPFMFHLCVLLFSAGQGEREALQAEEDGDWTVLCVEEQNLSHLEEAGGALLQPG